MFYKIVKLFKSFSAKERRIFIAALSVFVVSAVFLSVSAFYQSTVAEPVEGGVYTEGIIGQPIAINPLIAGDNDADRDLIALTFASFFDLAETYKTDEAQKVWNITLKPDLKWSDGAPLSSADVLFTIGIIQDPDTHSPLFATWQGVFAERLSELEIRLTLRNPFAFFLDSIKNLRVAPQHIFDNIPPQNFRLSEFNLKPVGSGPYKFVSREIRNDGFVERFAFTANKYYPLEKPFIRNFNVRFFANKTEAINAFNIKTVDGLGGIEENDREKLKVGHQVIAANRPRYYAIFLNPGTSLPLKEKEVRTALSLATDRARLIAEMLGGNGDPVYGPIPPSVEGYDAGLFAGEVFSPELASTTLDKAGWKISEDGVRQKTIQKTKVRLEFDLIVPEVRFLVDTAKLLQQDWRQIGVNLNPIILRSSDVINSALKPRSYQMLLFGQTLINQANPDAYSFWHSSQRFEPGLNFSLFSDKAVDGLLESIRQNTDPATRAQELSKLQRTISDQKPAIFLYSPRYLYVTSKNLGGFSADSIASSADRFIGVNRWYLKTARVFK